jgi:NADH dehydrogenase
MAKAQVVVVGGGYGGIRAIEHLNPFMGLEITLIDQNSYHYMQTEVYDYIANKESVSEIMVDLTSICRSFGEGRVRFVQSKVTGVDYEARQVETDAGPVAYDYLILATGSRTFFPDFIKGLREHAQGIKNIVKAMEFRQRFESAIFERIEAQGMGCDISEFNIVVGGAGLSGVEIAAEMADYANTFYENGNFSCKPVNVYLIDAYETILYGMDKFLVETSHKRLTELGVHVWHNNRIAEVKANEILLDNGKRLPYEFMIFTGGICASRLADALEDPKNRRGHLQVESTLNLPGRPEVFAVGDVAEILDSRGNLVPPTAQLAEQSAEHAAKNIIRLIKGKAVRNYTPVMRGVMIALGGTYGAGVLPGGIKVQGCLAYLIKKAIFHFYKRPLRLRSVIGSRAR